jgi:pimeloyl-ACP methyl ester carboxylesterase
MSSVLRHVALQLALACTAGCATGFHGGPMPGEPKEATFAEVGGSRVRYLDQGEGPAVVLIHGFASSLETWDDVIPKLLPHHRVIALDLKGFGWTDRPDGDYSPPAQAKLVLDLLTARGVDKAAVVAHSWGASIALQMALIAPERVERLALYSAWVYEDQLPSFFVWSRAPWIGEFLFGTFYGERPDERMEAAFYDPTRISERFVEAVERALDRPATKAAALRAARGQRFFELEPDYPDIDQPVLLLWGREDAVSRLSFGERLSRELPGARLVVYPRCGHFPMIEAEAASTRDLIAFLGERP